MTKAPKRIWAEFGYDMRRGALERYADESNWIETSAANDDPNDGRLRDIWDGGADGWTEARAALQDTKKTPTD